MRPRIRLLISAAAAVAAGVCALNAAAFELDASALRGSIDRQQAAGVPTSEVSALRARLDARLTPTAAFTTLALGGDPFRDLRSTVGATEAAAERRSRNRAADALAKLAGLRGGPPADYAAERSSLATASTPAGLDLLAERWTLAAETAELDRRTLSERSGGLTPDGRPADLAAVAPALDQAIGDAAGAGVSDDPAPAARDSLAAYWNLPIDGVLQQHDDVLATVSSAVDVVEKRVQAKARALTLAGGVDALLAQAAVIGVPDEVRAQAERGRDAAPGARTESEVHSALTDLEQATNALSAIVDRAPEAPLPPCLSTRSAGQLIWIHLATQQLIAYQDGCPWLGTQVTTGRPALPTDRGSFRIFYKAPAYKMVSPWPPGSPFWYPDAWVYDAMEFVGDGTFIHNADWQPDDTYGPGSEYGPYASHGCVHVPDAALARLYGWAQLGASVLVTD